MAVGDFLHDVLRDDARARDLFERALSLRPSPELETALRTRLRRPQRAQPTP